MPAGRLTSVIGCAHGRLSGSSAKGHQRTLPLVFAVFAVRRSRELGYRSTAATFGLIAGSLAIALFLLLLPFITAFAHVRFA